MPTWGDDSDDPDIESFTETDVDESSNGLSRQLSVSTGVFEVGDLSLTMDAEDEVSKLPHPSPQEGSASAYTSSSPPLTPTVPLNSAGIRFPRTEQVEEDSFERIDVPVPHAASPRHRSMWSGDQTVLAARPAVSARDATAPGSHDK